MSKTPPLGVYKKIASVFIGITVILVFVIFYYSLTYAFIKIKPKAVQENKTFTFVVSEDSKASDEQKGVFSGNLVDQTLEKSGTFEATGKKIVKSNMGGRVVLLNNNSKPQALITTTRLLTADNKLFRIKDGVTVPAGGRVEVEAYQDDSSIEASVKIGDRLTIPGLNSDLQKLIYAEILSDFSGQERDILVISKEDADQAVSKLINEMEDALRSTINEGERLVLSPEILEQKFSKLAGEEAEKFDVTVKARLKGVVFDENAVKSFTLKLIEGTINIDQELYQSENMMVNYKIDSIDNEKKVAQMSGESQIQLVIRQNAGILDPKKLVRLNADEVAGYLENYTEVESVEVKFFPFWVRRVPAFEDHVIISIEE